MITFVCLEHKQGLPFTGSGGNATMFPATVSYFAVPIIFTVGRTGHAFLAGSVKGGVLCPQHGWSVKLKLNAQFLICETSF